MKAKNFEENFESGDEILQHLDLSKAKTFTLTNKDAITLERVI